MSDGNRIVPGCYSQEEVDKDARIAKLDAMLRVAWEDIDDDFPDVVSDGDYEGWLEDLRRRAGKKVAP